MPNAQGFRDLRAYQLAFKLAMEIFQESKISPRRKSILSPIKFDGRREALASNIAEGYRKKRYPKMFVSKMADADGEATETQVWLDFAEACGYLPSKRQSQLRAGYEELGRMLGSMIAHPENFAR